MLGWYVLAAQLVQVEEPAAAEIDPEAQLMQVLAPLVEYEPAAHTPVTALKPVDAQELPEGQLKHNVSPALG